MDVKQTIKRNPFTSAAAILTSISMLSGAAWGIEERYNQANAVTGVEQRMLRNQIENYDDKIFQYQFLENEGKATPLDKALKERLKQKREDKQEELIELKK